MEAKLKHEHPMADWILQNVPHPLDLLFEGLFWKRVSEYKEHFDEALKYMTDVYKAGETSPSEVLSNAFTWEEAIPPNGFDEMEAIGLWLDENLKEDVECDFADAPFSFVENEDEDGEVSSYTIYLDKTKQWEGITILVKK